MAGLVQEGGANFLEQFGLGVAGALDIALVEEDAIELWRRAAHELLFGVGHYGKKAQHAGIMTLRDNLDRGHVADHDGDVRQELTNAVGESAERLFRDFFEGPLAERPGRARLQEIELAHFEPMLERVARAATMLLDQAEGVPSVGQVIAARRCLAELLLRMGELAPVDVA